jgi:hypothetical protein
VRHIGHLPRIVNILSSGMGGQVVWAMATDVSIDLMTQSSRYTNNVPRCKDSKTETGNKQSCKATRDP